ncbi:ADP-ribosylglycohydrolase family protein [Herbaspirillum sp. alder98]|uniref:ADP-ribosylglycohydrolase family protein n=1 Tax=Herbaspirillum sp. alder98 TaxID=2913096 RepID=UPI001CD83FB8|nr:ADP-ribosylglycohydrolase family protein [Herbaspirillum sp. alder98]MCA1325597.1 ADP-ribosylglycohydrolase family protein [Herbaspirillum sp. alder98]
MSSITLRDRIFASLALAGMGDALGAQTEQWSIEEIARRHGGLVTRFGTPPDDTFAGANAGLRGEVTDDASQMYYLARALIKAGGRLDYDGWVACLLDWAATSPKAGFMGPSTAMMVKALQEGGDINDVGIIGRSRRKMTTVGITNGAAMRVAPAGLVHPGDIEGACAQALVTCLPSHDTDVAISAACSIAAATAQALVAGDLHEVIAAAVRGGRIGEQLARQQARSVAGPNYLARLEMALRIADEAHDDYSFLVNMEKMVGNSVLAAESVPAALGVLRYAQGDPLRTIALCSSIGNDTDSIATMAGAVAGALRGTAALPVDLLDEFLLVNRADFDLAQMADGLHRIAAANAVAGAVR